jgi:hypothetical protein
MIRWVFILARECGLTHSSIPLYRTPRPCEPRRGAAGHQGRGVLQRAPKAGGGVGTVVGGGPLSLVARTLLSATPGLRTPDALESELLDPGFRALVRGDSGGQFLARCAWLTVVDGGP